jgi:cytochrome c-type biogenesis protein CcmF
MLTLGVTLIALAIASALLSSVSYALVIRGRASMMRVGRISAVAALGWAVASALLLVVLFVTERYDVRYVYDYSSADLEMHYRVASIWAGQPGSLVVWALVGLFCAPLLMRRTREFEPYVLSALMLLQACILVFMLMRNPFQPTIIDGVIANPIDGRGLNPILHNMWMVIHPPTLFVGYGVLGVTFCLALAGLIRRDYDGWARLAMPWTVAGWSILGLALAMGGYWAYESLGWGGYWGWDPVENAALVPWLAGTALLHGLVVQRAHGGLRRTNFVLAILTYGFVFYASFLTRSGVLGNFSVHSFVEEGLKPAMITTLIVLLVVGITLLSARWRDIPRKSLSDSLLSRDSALVLMMLTFMIASVVIALGTSLPWISSIKSVSDVLLDWVGRAFAIDDGTRFNDTPFADGRFGLMPDFFERTSSPLALVLASLMAIGPLLGWRSTKGSTLMRSLRWPFAGSIVVTSIAMALGVRDIVSLVFVLVATLALGTNLLMIVRSFRGGSGGWLRIGGYLAHVGMATMLVGVIGSYSYASPEERMVIPQGESQRMFGHTFTFWGYETKADGKHVLRLEVEDDADKTFVARPDVYFNERMGAWVRTPAIKRYLAQDLYISPEEYLPVDDKNTAFIRRGEQGNIGPYYIRFDSWDTHNGMNTGEITKVGATVTITNGDSVETYTPEILVTTSGEVAPIPVELDNGRELMLESVSVNSSIIKMRINGMNLPIVPERAVITVSTKPAIALVWLGTILMVVGGALAVFRRRVSVPLATRPVSSPTPDRGERIPSWREGYGVPAPSASFTAKWLRSPFKSRRRVT